MNRILLIALFFICLPHIAVAEKPALSMCDRVIDAQGHGPDPQSDEWWRSCYHKLLVGEWGRPTNGSDAVEGMRFHGNRMFDFININSMTGDKWALLKDFNLEIWSHTKKYPDPRGITYEIRWITPIELSLKPVNGMGSTVYMKLSPLK